MTILQSVLHTILYASYDAPQSRIVHMNSSDKYILFKHGVMGLCLPYPSATEYSQTKKNSVALANYLLRMGGTKKPLVDDSRHLHHHQSQGGGGSGGPADPNRCVFMSPLNDAAVEHLAGLTTHNLFDGQRKRKMTSVIRSAKAALKRDASAKAKEARAAKKRRVAPFGSASTPQSSLTSLGFTTTSSSRLSTPLSLSSTSLSRLSDLNVTESVPDVVASSLHQATRAAIQEGRNAKLPFSALPSLLPSASPDVAALYDMNANEEEDITELFSVSDITYNKPDDPADALGLAVARAVRLAQQEHKQRKREDRQAAKNARDAAKAAKNAAKAAKDAAKAAKAIKAAEKAAAKAAAKAAKAASKNSTPVSSFDMFEATPPCSPK